MSARIGVSCQFARWARWARWVLMTLLAAVLAGCGLEFTEPARDTEALFRASVLLMQQESGEARVAAAAALRPGRDADGNPRAVGGDSITLFGERLAGRPDETGSYHYGNTASLRLISELPILAEPVLELPAVGGVLELPIEISVPLIRRDGAYARTVSSATPLEIALRDVGQNQPHKDQSWFLTVDEDGTGGDRLFTMMGRGLPPERLVFPPEWLERSDASRMRVSLDIDNRVASEPVPGYRVELRITSRLQWQFSIDEP